MNIKIYQKLCAELKILWTQHCLQRMQERDISRLDVKNGIATGEIIEDYPDDYPNPSCLIFGYSVNGHILHIVAGCDNINIYIITAYYPDTRFKDSKKEVRNMCMYCKNSTTINSTTTHVVNYKNCIIVIKNVPCLECEQCGEKYYTDEVAERLEIIVNMAKKLMQEIAVIDYPQVA